MRVFSYLLFFILSNTAIKAQNLPAKMQISADGHTLKTGGSNSTGFYDDNTIRTIYLEFAQSDYKAQLAANYQTRTNILAKMTVDGVVYDSVGVHYKGNTSYNMVQNSDKKSFNISLDFVHPDQKIMGYGTLNLNNAFEDESFLREVLYTKQIRNHIPAAQSNFVQLYINGQSWGIYPNVQQIDKSFLKEWFMSNNGSNWRADKPNGTGGGGPGGPGGGAGWGDGTAALNGLGADTLQYQKYYTLKSTEKEHPWEDLMTACQALKNTAIADIETVLPTYFDIDRILWHLASEIAWADDDSYVFKGKMDFYVYNEPETGRFTLIETDGNSALPNGTTNWGPFYNETKVNYPLLNRLLQVPALRQRYLAHLRTILADEFDATATATIVDNYYTHIDSLVNKDPKKLYTYTAFNAEKAKLKTFINARRNFLNTQPDVNKIGPSITNAAYYADNTEWKQPVGNQEVTVKTTVTAAAGLDHVFMYYATGMVGNFTKVTMLDDGAHNDGAANDNVFGAIIPAQAAGTMVRFYIEAAVAGTVKTTSFLPVGAEHDVFIYRVAMAISDNQNLAINEVMAINQNTVVDENNEKEDWIEIYNKSNQTINLSGYFITDNPDNLNKWDFPAGTQLAANDYLILWADEDSAQGPLHCNFKLAAAGETLLLLDPTLALVDSMSFGPQQANKALARIPNGTGNFVVQAHTFDGNNEIPLGTKNIIDFSSIAIVPNPARDFVLIALKDKSDAPLEIYNALGQKVFSTTSISSQLRVSVSDWQSGVYVVRCGLQGGRFLVE
jgi:hypothetical protein